MFHKCEISEARIKEPKLLEWLVTIPTQPDLKWVARTKKLCLSITTVLL